VIVLNKVTVNPGQLVPGTLIEALKKEAAIVAEQFRLNNQDIGNGSGDDVHPVTPNKMS
jgi:hypothetical protein